MISILSFRLFFLTVLLAQLTLSQIRSDLTGREYCIPDTKTHVARRPVLEGPFSSLPFKQVGGFEWTTPVVIDTSTPNVWSQLWSVLAVDDSGNLIAAFTEEFLGGGFQIVVERSTDKGETWIKSVPFGRLYGIQSQDIAFDRDGNVWLLWASMAGEFDPIYIHLSKSTDNGQTFSTLFTSLEYAAPFFEPKLAIDRSNNVFMLWDDQQFKLTRFTNGDPGHRVDTEVPNDTLLVDSWCSLAVGPGGNVYCIWTGVQPNGSRYKIYCSTSRDTGTTFTSTVRVDTTEFIGSYSAQRYPNCAVDTSGNIYVAYSRQSDINTLGLQVATSIDQGINFLLPVSLLEPGFNTNPSMCIDVEGGIDIFWAGDGGAHFSRSTDSGSTFTSPIVIPVGLSDLNADCLGNLFSTFNAGRRAILFAKTNVLVNVTGSQPIPQFVELHQNYPNPFNPSTMIRFVLRERAQVRLAIFDVLGHQVEELTDQSLEAGVHHVMWKPVGLSSGAYFYRLEVYREGGGGTLMTRNIIYLK